MHRFHFYGVPRAVIFIKIERPVVVTSWWGKENGELFNGTRISVLQNEKNSGDRLHNSVDVLTTTELDSQKWLR